MFSHVTVGTRNLQASACFYDAVLQPMGLIRRQVDTHPGGVESVCWVAPNSPLPRFYVYMPFDRQPASAGNGSMVAFRAPTKAAVDFAYHAGLAAGGLDEGKPAERQHYGAGYYGAYLRDPDGNKVHMVYRGDLADA
ncbi:MAG TPA: VOC family protein [Limnobacter sp.]|nr:VOC family protein [Limnobacter sp.]